VAGALAIGGAVLDGLARQRPDAEEVLAGGVAQAEAPAELGDDLVLGGLAEQRFDDGLAQAEGRATQWEFRS
jgi:hypothetical protein